MKNKLTDLNNHLFAEMERLGDEELTGDKLLEEIGRAKAITDVAKTIVDNAEVVLKATVAAAGAMNANYKVPALIGIETKEEEAAYKQRQMP